MGTIKKRLDRIMQEIGDPEEEINYLYLVWRVAGRDGQEERVIITKRKGKKFLETITEGHPEWDKAMERYRKGKEARKTDKYR